VVERSDTTTSPGKAIEMELVKRGWTHDDLARALGKHRPLVTSLISGKRSITPEIAVALSGALGHGADYWMTLESSRQLSLIPQVADDVIKRARLLELAPLNEMERRGWISPTTDARELEQQLRKFYGVESLDDEPSIFFLARKSNPEAPLDKEQRAWCARAKQLASALVVDRFDAQRLPELVAKLRRLAAFPKEAAWACDLLRQYGIRFVVVEPLKRSRIDGAAFWIDEHSPAIAISLRYGRMDAFWFTLMHELAHIVHGDAASIDNDLHGEELLPSRMKVDVERRADETAASMLVREEDMSSFIKMFSPLYSRARINQFAHRVKIHPAIIVGQLQHRSEIGWGSHRELFHDVREVVTSTALTDGWGKSISPGIVS
jgi:HTH-type transcriptional regulator/antitoxin HigA